MKKRGLLVFLIVFIVLLTPVFAQDWDFSASKMTIDFNVGTTLSIKPTSSVYQLKKVTADLFFFPKDDSRQKNIEVNADADISEDAVSYIWSNPKEDIELKYNAKIETVNIANRINKKITFPIKDLPVETRPYLEENELMNIKDPSIIELATTLAEGEDDVYIVVFKMASWVRDNIEYDLDTLTAEASLSASWVLSNRRGVCDEMTNLFISLVRVLGIPAKFVAGISYTESDLFTEPWGPHGWAEVYLPGHGWVPFDVTYGQLGNIDPTHIKLKESAESDKTSSSFEWLGNNVNLESSGLKFDINVIDFGEKIKDRVTVTNKILSDEIGYGSHNLIATTVKNNLDYYVPVNLAISRSESILVLDNMKKHILLSPGQEETVYWKFKIDDDLDKRSIYTFYITTYTYYNENDTISFKGFDGAPVLSYYDVKDQQKLLEGETSKQYSASVIMECSTDKNEYYLNENVKVDCNLKNNGNKNLDAINVCVNQQCKKTEVKIAQERNVVFVLENLNAKSYEMYVTANNEDVSKSVKLNFAVEELPVLEIFDEEIPETVMFSEPFKVRFSIDKKTSDANDVSIMLISDYTGEQWTFEKLDENKDFVVSIEGGKLPALVNNMKIKVAYHDKNGKEYITEKDYVITIPELSLKDRAVMLFNRVNSDKRLASIIIGVLVLLIFVTGVLMHVGKKR